MLKDDITLCGAVCVWFSKEPRPWASGRFINCKWDVDELEAQKDSIEADKRERKTKDEERKQAASAATASWARTS